METYDNDAITREYNRQISSFRNKIFLAQIKIDQTYREIEELREIRNKLKKIASIISEIRSDSIISISKLPLQIISAPARLNLNFFSPISTIVKDVSAENSANNSVRTIEIKIRELEEDIKRYRRDIISYNERIKQIEFLLEMHKSGRDIMK